MSTPSRTPDEQALEILEPALNRIDATLGSLRSAVTAQFTRANVTLADLQKRVSALEQRQGMGETKRAARRPHGKAKR